MHLLDNKVFCICDFYAPPNIVTNTQSGRMGWVGHAAHLQNRGLKVSRKESTMESYASKEAQGLEKETRRSGLDELRADYTTGWINVLHYSVKTVDSHVARIR